MILFIGPTTGFGGPYDGALFSPWKEPGIKGPDGEGSLLWDLGFNAGIPTASSKILGTGQWQAGPAVLLVTPGAKWNVGFLGQHERDFAGDPDRDSVHLSKIQTSYGDSLEVVTSTC